MGLDLKKRKREKEKKIFFKNREKQSFL